MPGMIVLGRSVLQIPDSEEAGLADHIRPVGGLIEAAEVRRIVVDRERGATLYRGDPRNLPSAECLARDGGRAPTADPRCRRYRLGPYTRVAYGDAERRGEGLGAAPQVG